MTQERLKELFDYDMRGFFIEKTNRNPKYKNSFGKVVNGTVFKNGYRMLTVDKKLYIMHRLIFLWHNAFLPNYLDHINRNKSDNRIENLRPASRAENRNNTGLQKNNTSGYKGVSLKKGRWVAVINRGDFKKHIGTFDTPEDASFAYNKYASEIDGDFACLNI